MRKPLIKWIDKTGKECSIACRILPMKERYRIPRRFSRFETPTYEEIVDCELGESPTRKSSYSGMIIGIYNDCPNIIYRLKNRKIVETRAFHRDSTEMVIRESIEVD